MANDIIDIIVTDNSDNVQLNVTPNLVSINVSQTSGNIIGSNYYLASTFSALPITGDLTTLYVINDTSLMYRWSGSAYTQINSSAVVAWGQITGTLSGQTDLQTALNLKAPLASPTFTGTVSGITKSMVGLSNVDNTSDVNKPISTATQTALNLKADINNPTFTGTVGGITKAMVGLGNVDNTSDVNKPISSATQTALDTKAPLASPTFTGTVSGITKSMVGLGNVDNTTDLLKPISTATQSALNLKYDASNPAGYTTNVGTVTSVGGTGTVSGLSLSGSVTTSGNLTLGGTLSLTSGNVTTALGYTPYDATNPSGYISGITSGNITTALGYTPENAANKGIANGYASLDGGGLVPSTQLPSYVDDVLEFADLAAFPASGTTGKIYVALDTNKIYRWSGATYIEVSPTVGTIWGGITGTLSNQTDLQNALNAKQNNLTGTGFVKSTAGTISYDTATYYPYPTGTTTQYVAGDGSLIAFPISGQAGTIVRLVRNQTGATLTKGTVVYIDGATGNNPTVAKAIATGDSTSAQTFGLCQANIANNAEGYVVIMGDLVGLNTSSFTEGQQLYLSSTTAGEYTTTKQYAPAHLVYVGVVTRSHVSLGQIEVRIQNGYEMDELHNVSAQSPSNNDGLFYNTTTSLWEKKSIATALGFTPYNATNPNNYIALTGLSSTATGLTYTNTTGVFSLTAGYAIPTTASATTWDTAYTNRITSLTVTGSSGSATLVSNVLNIPTYTLSGLGGITASFLSGTSGISYNSTTGVISTSLTQYTDALARASVSLTTTGTSGASTYNSTTGVLNIPNYGSALSGYLPLTGGTLTGVLGGTSATFSGQVNAASKYTWGSSTTGTTGQIATDGTNNYFDYIGSLIFRGAAASNTLVTFTSAGAATFSSSVAIGAGLRFSSNTTEGEIVGTAGRGLKFYTNDGNSNPLNLTSAGNCGIGTTSPDSKLNVVGGRSTFYANSEAFAINVKYNSAAARGYWIGSPASGIMTFSNADGNERLRITDAGNVGIGTSSPAYKLHIAGVAANTISYISDTTGFAITQLSNTGGNLYYGIDSSTAGAFANGAYSRHIYSNGAYPLIISTNDVERMRITSAGNVGIGTSSPSTLLHAKTTGDGYNMLTIEATGGDAGIALKGGIGGTSVGGFTIQGQIGGSMVFVDRNSTPATRMTISSNGSIGAPSGTNIYNASDARLKKNISTTTYGLDTISALNPVKFNWVDGFEPSENGKDMLGFIAQEVQSILPEAIESFGGNSITIGDTIIENTLRINEKFIIPVLVKAIQELSAKVSLLENK